MQKKKVAHDFRHDPRNIRLFLLPAIQVRNLNGLLRGANEIWFFQRINSAYGAFPNFNFGQKNHPVHRGGVFGLNEGEEATETDASFGPLVLHTYKIRCSVQTYIVSAIF